VGVDARVLTELADAIASRKRDLATFDDRDGHARHAVLFQYRFDMRVESGWRCGKGRSGEQGSGHEDRGAQAMPNRMHGDLHEPGQGTSATSRDGRLHSSHTPQVISGST